MCVLRALIHHDRCSGLSASFVHARSSIQIVKYILHGLAFCKIVTDLWTSSIWPYFDSHVTSRQSSGEEFRATTYTRTESIIRYKIRWEKCKQSILIPLFLRVFLGSQNVLTDLTLTGLHFILCIHTKNPICLFLLGNSWDSEHIIISFVNFSEPR